MAKKKSVGYLSAKESRLISRENRKITNALEKERKRKNVPESEYLTTMRDPKNVLEIEDLHTHFFTDVGVVKAVDGISFDVPEGKTLGVVGESGCGKSVTSLSIMQLLQRPQGQVVGGEIRLNLGDKAYDIAKTPQDKMQSIRGETISMIFQEPMTSLNPVFRIGAQIDEVIMLHEGHRKTNDTIKARTIELLELVGIANATGVYRMFPHELSGGMRQRVMIAMALACNPKLIIADEPTTALDVTIQAQILDLLRRLKDKINSSIMLITHDLGVIAEMADYVVVMYAGRIVELNYLIDLVAYPEYRIETRHRLLEYHRNEITAELLHYFDRCLGYIISLVAEVYPDASAYDLSLRSLQELHCRKARYGLAAAGLSYYSYSLTLRNFKCNTVYSLCCSYISKEVCVQIIDLQNVSFVVHLCKILAFRNVFAFISFFEFIGYPAVFLGDAPGFLGGKITCCVFFLSHYLSSLSLHLRVKRISETVSYDIEREYGDQQQYARRYPDEPVVCQYECIVDVVNDIAP